MTKSNLTFSDNWGAYEYSWNDKPIFSVTAISVKKNDGTIVELKARFVSIRNAVYDMGHEYKVSTHVMQYYDEIMDRWSDIDNDRLAKRVVNIKQEEE